MKGMNCNEKYILHIENSRARTLVIWENLGKYGGTDMLGTYKIQNRFGGRGKRTYKQQAKKQATFLNAESC